MLKICKSSGGIWPRKVGEKRYFLAGFGKKAIIGWIPREAENAENDVSTNAGSISYPGLRTRH
jgi:hypothetical protein